MVKKKEKKKSITGLVVDQLAEIYPYFIVIYITLFIFSKFFPGLDKIIYWRGFHTSALLWSIVAVTSSHVRGFLWRAYLEAVEGSETAAGATRLFFAFVFRMVRKVPVGIYFKSAAVMAGVAFASQAGADAFDVIIVGYALLSLLFGFDSKFAAGAAIFFLTITPIAIELYGEKKITERFAVYAFYFLAITVATQIRELYSEKKEVMH